MKVGLVGKPSAGKSTFFKAATLIDAKIGNFPFTTITPNVGFGFVKVECPEKFFNVKCNPRQGYCIDGNRFVPVELIDVAGLVPDAHLGKGMGNKFLDDLRQADCLIHIVDTSGTTDAEGKECIEHNPSEDLDFLEKEINYWWLSIVEKNWKKINNEKDLAKQLSGLRVNVLDVKEVIEKSGLNENLRKWEEADRMKFIKQLREKKLPIIIAANKIDRPEAKKWLPKQIERGAIPCSADSELALREAAKKNMIKYIPGEGNFELTGEINEKQKEALERIRTLMKDFGSTGVQKIINKAVFGLLNYLVIFPGGLKKLSDKQGNVLPDAFLMPPNSTALDFAYKLHQDFGDKFIAAINVKTKQRVGKDYKLENGDVIEIIAGR